MIILQKSTDNFNSIAQNLTDNQIILASRIKQVEYSIQRKKLGEMREYEYFLVHILTSQILSEYQAVVYDTLKKKSLN